MKKQFLLAFGLASMMLAGCSDSDNVADGGNTPDPNAKSYLSLRLNLPTTTGSGSRADDNFKNDQFDTDRIVSDEYKVNDITLVCFNASNEIVGKVELTGSYNWANGTETGITTQAVLPIQEVNKDTRKVLVLVNKPASGLTLDNGTTFSAFNAELSTTVDDLIGTGKDDFFMTNSPLSNRKDGGTSLTTVLVDVKPQNTKEAAMANQRDIYVERAVGKVSMSVGAGWNAANWTYSITADEGFKGDQIKIVAWTIDNYNTKMFPVRKYVDKASTWEEFTTKPERFVGALKYYGNQYFSIDPSKRETDGKLEGRTYWCEDPNYDGNTGLHTSTNNLINATDVAAMQKPQYCMENTFDVQHMSLKNTTRVIIKALYTPKDFAEGTWYRLGNSSKPYNLTTLEAKINAELGLTGTNIVKLKTTGYTYAQGEQEFAAAMFQDATPGTNAAITPAQITKLNNQLGKLIAYIDGYCYYTALVKHFGSEYTPWGEETGAPTDGTTTFHNYVTSHTANDENYYLGRYGIVRNNWYQLELGKVSAPGTAKVPKVDTDNTADDEQKYYIQATVKIMDWAVRKQTVDL